MKRFPIVLAVAAMALVGVQSGAFGQATSGGVKINGGAANTTIANGNNAVTTGLLNTTKQNIGAIAGGTEVNGVLSNTTIANGNNAVTTGLLNETCQNVGYVGDLPEGC